MCGCEKEDVMNILGEMPFEIVFAKVHHEFGFNIKSTEIRNFLFTADTMLTKFHMGN